MTTDTEVRASRHSKVMALATARILVAYLGEKAQFDWWPTSFFTSTGLRFLEYNFPRTIVSAAVQSVSHAAKQLHDQKIGKAGSFHLFRLPHDIEQDIHAAILEIPRDALSRLFAGQQESLDELKKLANGESLEAIGPIRVADIGQVTTKPALRRLPGYYCSAFKNRTQVFPYFTIE